MTSWCYQGNVLDPVSGVCRARVAVSQGRIVEVRPLSGEVEDAVDADSATLMGGSELWMLPGFVDGHTHLTGMGLRFFRPDLSAVRSAAELLERLSGWVEAHPGDRPVIGEGWDQSLWKDSSLPTRADLDRICPDRPVILRRVCGHVVVVNGAVLARAGIRWPDLDVDSGLAREALPLALPRLFPPSDEEMDQALARAQERALSLGVTGIQEMGAPLGFRAFARAQAGGRLHLRVTHFFIHDTLDRLVENGLVAGLGGDRLRVGGIKIFLDGSIGGRSAATREEYLEGGRGLLLLNDEELREILLSACRNGYQPAMHAIGDRAVEQAIRLTESVRAGGEVFARPGPRLEHAEMADEDLLSRAAAAGLHASMQPNFTARWQNAGQLYEQVLGRKRADALNPYRTAARCGRLLFGSDTMPLDPWLGLRGALGHPVADERLTLHQALRAYTAGAAAAVSHPFPQGRIAAGACADFLLARFPAEEGERWMALLRGEPGSLPEKRPLLATFVDGIARAVDPALELPGGSVAPWSTASGESGA